MTVEEAIERVSRWLDKGKQHSDYQLGYIEGWFTKEDEQAFLMAINALQTEPFINKPCVSEQACHEDKVKVLENIKAEIEAKCCITVGRECDGAITLHDVFEIIDKYKAESEGEK